MALALLLHRFHEQACCYCGSDGHQNIELERQRKSGHGGSGGHPVASQVARSNNNEQNTSSASTPAKPSPQDSGMAFGQHNAHDGRTCHASQLTQAAPQKRAPAPAQAGCGKALHEGHKDHIPLKYPIASRWRKGRCWK